MSACEVCTLLLMWHWLGRMQVERTYTGPQTGDIVDHMKACNPRGPLVIAVAKLFPKTDVSAFDALGRILSGTVKPGDRVRVLGEAYTPEDEEDSAVAEVTKVWVYQARYRIPLTKALAGAPQEHTPSDVCSRQDPFSRSIRRHRIQLADLRRSVLCKVWQLLCPMASACCNPKDVPCSCQSPCIPSSPTLQHRLLASGSKKRGANFEP